MTEWQPIETAPRDGTTILIAFVCCEIEDIEFAIWSQDVNAWYILDDSFLDDECEIFGWQPLPEFPKKKHYCKEFGYMCESVDGELRIIFDTLPGYLSANFCPICGEKA